jgi:hypothetical protein
VFHNFTIANIKQAVVKMADMIEVLSDIKSEMPNKHPPQVNSYCPAPGAIMSENWRGQERMQRRPCGGVILLKEGLVIPLIDTNQTSFTGMRK